MSDFASEIPKYPQTPKTPNSPKMGISITRGPGLSKIDAKFRHHYRKSGSSSKNMTSDLALEVAKQLKRSPKPPNSAKSVQAYCLAVLSDAACFIWYFYVHVFSPRLYYNFIFNFSSISFRRLSAFLTCLLYQLFNCILTALSPQRLCYVDNRVLLVSTGEQPSCCYRQTSAVCL